MRCSRSLPLLPALLLIAATHSLAQQPPGLPIFPSTPSVQGGVIITPITLSARIDVVYPDCPPGEELNIQIFSSFTDHGNGNTERARWQTYTCVPVVGPPVSSNNNSSQGSIYSKRIIDVDYDGQRTTFTYQVYQDSTPVYTLTSSVNEDPLQATMGHTNRVQRMGVGTLVSYIAQQAAQDNQNNSGNSNSPGNSPGGTGSITPCFGPDTLIAMADGSRKPISDIDIGDIVLAYDRLSSPVPRAVTGIQKQVAYAVSLNGTIVTPDHAFLQPDGSFLALAEFPSDGLIVNHDGTTVSLPSVSPLGSMIVHNITVHGLHTYIADNMRVHD